MLCVWWLPYRCDCTAKNSSCLASSSSSNLSFLSPGLAKVFESFKKMQQYSLKLSLWRQIFFKWLSYTPFKANSLIIITIAAK